MGIFSDGGKRALKLQANQTMATIGVHTNGEPCAGVEISTNIFNTSMKEGVDQASAGADAGELWCDTDDGYVVKKGQ